MKFKKFIFKKVKSTNDIALKLVKLGHQRGAVVAEYQSKGRGRRGNIWISKKGNLYMSIFFEIKKKISIKKITRLNISIIKNIISKKILTKVSFKKPNDILINEKKVCGILQEIKFKNNVKFLIVGIGINIVSSPNVINYDTTYLNNYSKKKINKLKLFNEIKLKYEKKMDYFKR